MLKQALSIQPLFDRNTFRQLFGGRIDEIQKHFKWKLKTNFPSLFYYMDTSVLNTGKYTTRVADFPQPN